MIHNWCQQMQGIGGIRIGYKNNRIELDCLAFADDVVLSESLKEVQNSKNKQVRQVSFLIRK